MPTLFPSLSPPRRSWLIRRVIGDRGMFRLLLGALISGSTAMADVRLPAIVSDHMVLQKSDRAPVWGWAAPGEEVIVTLGTRSANTVTDEDGRWRVNLATKDLGAGPHELTVQGSNTLTLKDVLVGEVWLCSGQSNMEMRLSTTGAKDVIAKADNPLLRHFKVEKSSAKTPADDVTGRWVLAVPATVGEFSGVGYFFGQALQQDLKVPVGLIHASWGGSLAESWMSPEALASSPEIKERAASLLRLAEQPSDKPTLPSKIPSALFNGMLAPVIPYAIAGVIWYQGESNAGSGLAPLYPKLLSAMLEDWRTRWQSGDFPLYICQLANNQLKRSEPGLASTWAEFREAQAQFGNRPDAGVAILIDVGEEGTVHPANKRDPGERLARIALAKTYGRDVVYSGPIYESSAVEGDKIRIKFTNTDGGLVARPLPDTYQPMSNKPDETRPLIKNSPGSELQGFLICGENRKWAWADAKIEGNDVVVWSSKVPQPIAVRYAWDNNPTCNLYNGAGLPAGPFRTDSFAGTVRKNPPPPVATP